MQPTPLPYGFPAPPPAPAPPTAWPVVAAVLVGLWTVAVTVAAQVVAWFVGQVLLVSGLDQPAWLWPVASVGNAVLVAAPSLLLATVPRSAAVRAAGRAWLVAALALGGLGSLRAIPAPHHEVYLAALAVAATAAALIARRVATPRLGATAYGPPAPAARPLAIAAGLAVLLPWLWAGALGGPLETALAVAAAAAVAALAGAVLDGPFWSTVGGSSGVRLVLVGGLVAGVALMLVAAGTGHGGTDLAVMLVLPPTGFVVAALQPMSRLVARRAAWLVPGAAAATSAPLRWVVGLAVLGPLALTDPEEISLILATGRDVPFWTVLAAVGSLAVAGLLAIAYGLIFARANAPLLHRWVGLVAAALVLVAAAGVYAGPGQPGWHGERLFVVLREQADLSGIPAGARGPAGREARAREVYRRLVETAERSQTGLRRELDRLHLDYTPYYLVNAVEVSGAAVVRAWLSRRAEVDRVLLSQRLRPLPAAPTVASGHAAGSPGPAWNIRLIGADRVSRLGVRGAGIVVGSSDSGVDAGHPALAGGFRGGDDSWYDPWNGTRTPIDRAGHGTHTLGTAVGTGGIGVAPGAKWVGCVNLDRNLGNPAHYLDCLQFMLAPFPYGGDPFADGRPERGPHVLTNSWGCPTIEGCDRDALRPATAALAAAGVFVVAAAGNTGPFCGSVEDPPAPYPDVLTVGAVDDRRVVTSRSSRGPAPGGGRKPDLVAPGAGVLSAMPGGGYETLDGTSMAAPHVAGVVALMWSANPALIGDLPATRRILVETAARATPSPSAGASTGARRGACGDPANVVGGGLVDAYAAVLAARAAK